MEIMPNPLVSPEVFNAEREVERLQREVEKARRRVAIVGTKGLRKGWVGLKDWLDARGITLVSWQEQLAREWAEKPIGSGKSFLIEKLREFDRGWGSWERME